MKPLIVENLAIPLEQVINLKKLKNKIGKYNLFCDACVKKEKKKVGIGGFISSTKQLILQYKQELDYEIFEDNNLSEMNAIYQGLIIVKQQNINSIIIFTDSSVSIENIEKFKLSKKINIKYEELILKINKELKEFENYELNLITRNLNSYSDFLSKV